MDTPFFDAMDRLAGHETRFFVPGHKGNPAAIAPFGPLLRYDLTEIDGADDLSCPTGPLAESQRNMTEAYESGATLYSASGSSSCIQAMLTLFVGAGGGVVMARGCHVSAVRALALLDARPHWVPLTNGRPHPRDIEGALMQSGYKVVYLTSPDYYGRMADMAQIAALCRRYGAALLVDNAQGAHLHFLWPDAHPLSMGADATADSAHKTLPCLTPAAMLHLRDASLAEAAREALNLYSSTSPSYLVLESLDLAAGLLLEGEVDFDAAAGRLREVADAAPGLAALCDDPLRMCLHPASAGLEYADVLAGLDKAGIAPEYADGSTLVLMASPWNTPADFDLLERTLVQLAQAKPGDAGQPLAKTSAADSDALTQNLPIPRRVCSVRRALFGPKERLPLAQAEGRVMAGLHVSCPPGVPLVVPGEALGEAEIAALAAGGILAVDVVK